jgi:hypothetical protein
VGLNALNVEKEGMLLILQEQVVALIAVLVVVNQKKVQHFVLIVPQELIRILLHPSHATTAHKTTTKIYWAIPRAMHVPPVSVTKSKDLRRAMPFHLDRIFGTKQFKDANRDIFVLAEHSNSLVLVVDTPQKWGRSSASPAHQENTPMKNNQFDVKHVQMDGCKQGKDQWNARRHQRVTLPRVARISFPSKGVGTRVSATRKGFAKTLCLVHLVQLELLSFCVNIARLVKQVLGAVLLVSIVKRESLPMHLVPRARIAPVGFTNPTTTNPVRLVRVALWVMELS